MDLLEESEELFDLATMDLMASRIKYEKIDLRNRNHEYYWVLRTMFGDPSSTYAFETEEEAHGTAFDSAVIALSEDKLVGLWRYGRQGNQVTSYGTWVHPSFRNLGIGKKLWSTILLTQKVNRVTVDVATDKGKTLVDSLRERYPRIKFTGEELSGRKLRNLKNAKSRKEKAA